MESCQPIKRSKDKKKEEVSSLHVACVLLIPAIISELTGFRTSGDRYFSTNYCFEPVWPNIVMSRSVTSASGNGVHSQNVTCICNKKLNNCA